MVVVIHVLLPHTVYTYTDGRSSAVVVVDKENGKMGKKKVKDGKTKKKFFVCIFTKFVEQSILSVVVVAMITMMAEENVLVPLMLLLWSLDPLKNFLHL